MSEDTKKLEKSEPETSATQLSEQDLNKVAGVILAGGIVAINPTQTRESTIPSVSEIVVTKVTDSASPSLFKAADGA